MGKSKSSTPEMFRFPLSYHIDIPKNAILISVPEETQHGLVYLDKEHNSVYRKMEIGLQGSGNELNEIENFWQKLATHMDDRVALTPRIYRFDPANYILEMEYVDGDRLDKVAIENIPLNSVRRLWTELHEYHRQGLYHGDLFSGKNYILEKSGRIRLIDPTHEIDPGQVEASVENIQHRDRIQVLDLLKRYFGYSEANVTGSLIEPIETRRGVGIKSELTPEIIQASRDDEIVNVYQRGIGILDPVSDKKRYIETSDFGSERPGIGSGVTVVCRDLFSGKTALVHADTLTDLSKARAVVESELDGNFVSISVIGGESNHSEPIIEKINSEFSKIHGATLTNIDILGQRGLSNRQVVVDTKTGEIFVLYSDARRNLKNAKELQRITTSKRNERIGLGEKQLIVDYPSSFKLEPVETSPDLTPAELPQIETDYPVFSVNTERKLLEWGVRPEQILEIVERVGFHEKDYTNLELRAKIIGQTTKYITDDNYVYIRGGYNSMGGYPAGECSDIAHTLYFEFNYLEIADTLRSKGIHLLYCSGKEPEFFNGKESNHKF